MSLRIAVIGCGAVVADLHVPVLEKLERAGVAMVAAVADPAQARAAAIGRFFKAPKLHTRMEDLWRETPCDLAFIASPPGLHFEQALAAIRAGAHVLVEKPMVTRAADAAALAKASADSGRIVAVGQTRRFYPNLRAVRRRLDAGDFGGPVRFAFYEGGVFDWPVASGAVFDRAKAGGGVLFDKGVHVLDVLNGLFGGAKVLRAWDDSLAGGVEANAVVELEYEGASGTVQISWDQPLCNGLQITGPKAEARIDLDAIGRYQFRGSDGNWRWEPADERWPRSLGAPAAEFTPTDYYECVEAQWWTMLRAIQGDGAPAVDAAGAANVIEAIEEAYRVAQPLNLSFLSAAERGEAVRRHWRVGS
jgi:predicted dehydrogenase